MVHVNDRSEVAVPHHIALIINNPCKISLKDAEFTSRKQRMNDHGASCFLHVINEEPELLATNPILITEEDLWAKSSSTEFLGLIDKTWIVYIRNHHHVY